MRRTTFLYFFRISILLSLVLFGDFGAACTAANTIDLRVASDSAITLNSTILKTTEDVTKFPGLLESEITLRSELSQNSSAIFRALELLCDGGVLKLKLAGKDMLYGYTFPVADGGRSTPWCDLEALPRSKAILITPHIFLFDDRPNAVLVLVDVGRNKLTCDANVGSAQALELFESLKNKYALVAISFEVEKTANYADMLNALSVAKQARLKSYSFSDR